MLYNSLLPFVLQSLMPSSITFKMLLWCHPYFSWAPERPTVNDFGLGHAEQHCTLGTHMTTCLYTAILGYMSCRLCVLYVIFALCACYNWFFTMWMVISFPVLMSPIYFLFLLIHYLGYMSCRLCLLYVIFALCPCHNWFFTMCMVIPFPDLMSHIYFLFLPIHYLCK